MTIKVGDTVRLVRMRVRTGGGTKPNECQIWETVELAKSQQKVGLVIQSPDNYTSQMTVLCDGKEKYWFLKNVEKVEK